MYLICREATTGTPQALNWDFKTRSAKYLHEARQRGYSLDQCAPVIQEGRNKRMQYFSDKPAVY